MPFILVSRLPFKSKRSVTGQRSPRKLAVSVKLAADPSPISHIPPEIIAQIMAWTIGNHSSRPKYLHSLAQVCKGWAAIILGTPLLWTFVDSSWLRADWTRALVLSKHHTLDIRIQDRPNWEHGPQRNFWDAIVGCMPRWRSVEINPEPGPTWVLNEEMLKDIEGCSAPELVEFTLLPGPIPANQRPLDLFRGQAPKLRRLRLALVTLQNWAAPFLGRLTSLALESCPNGPTLVELAETLQSCSETLEELTLARISYRSLDHPLPSPFASNLPIVLKRLQSFTSDQAGLSVLPLLQRISIPNATQVAIQFYWWPESTPSVARKALSVAGSTVQGVDRVFLPQPPMMTFCYRSANSLHITFIIPKRCHINIAVGSVSPLTVNDILVWVIAAQSLFPVMTTDLVLHRSKHMSGVDIVPVLHGIHNITSLVLSEWYGGELEPILKALSLMEVWSVERVLFRFCALAAKNSVLMTNLINARAATEIWWHGYGKHGAVRLDCRTAGDELRP